jgi:hypothetical protein
VSLAPVVGYSSAWEYAPSVTTGLSYESNPDYVPQNSQQDDAYSAFLDAALAIGTESGRSRIDFRPRFFASTFRGSLRSDDLGGTDYYLPLDGSWITQRVRLAAGIGYSQISTRNSEVFETDPNESPQTGVSGHVVSIDEDQKRLYFSPSISYQVGPRDVIQLTLSMQDVRYTEWQRTFRSNYIYGTTSGSWVHSLGLKSQVSIGLNLDAFKAEGRRQAWPPAGTVIFPEGTIDNETTSYGFDAGYQYSLSDLTTIGITGGMSQSDITVSGLAPPRVPLPCFDAEQGILVTCTFKSTERNFVGRLFLRRQTAETITTEFSVARSLQPNSDGAQVTDDSARVYLSKQFTPNLSGTLGLAYVSQKAVGADSATGLVGQRFDRDYARADAAMSWRFTPVWSIEARYAYSQDRQNVVFDISEDTATTVNNIVTLQLRYQGLGSH